MANILLQVTCSFLFAVGLLFIFLELRTHFDRSFRFFGVSLVLLCGMTCIDLWITPNITSVHDNVFWQRVYHSLACTFIPFSLWYLCLLTNSPFLKAIPFLILASTLMAFGFMGGLMIVEQSGTVA